MKACGDMRERLGEWLAGALEGEAAAAVERHVGACAGCARELAAMTSLEEDLRSLGPTPVVRRGPPRWLAVAAGLLMMATVAFVALRREGAGPHYIAAVVEAEAGARIDRLDARGARLERGAAEVHVQPGSGASAGEFRIETPLGRFTVKGTRFRISVEEDVQVTNAGKAGVIAVVAVVSGTVGYLSHDGKTQGTVGAGERGVARQGSFEVAAAEPPKSAEREEIARLKKEIDAIQAERKQLTESIEQSRAEKKAVEAKLAAVEQERLTAAKAREAAAPKKKAIPVSFGPHATVPEVADANWSEMGEAVKNINGFLGDLLDKEKRGEGGTELQVAIAKENMKLQKFAFAAIGKLPTHAPGNGEFTHPIALANLMAEHLKAAGLELTERQVADIAGFGEEYDLEWERLQSSYGPQTYMLEKILDELEAKHRFFEKALGVMAPEQRMVIANPEYHDLFAIDVHSPVLMLATVAKPYPIASANELAPKVVEAVARDLTLEKDEQDIIVPVVQRLAAELAPKLKPCEKDEVQFYPYDEAVAAGRAVLKLRKELPIALGLDEAATSKLRDERGFGIPRIAVEKK